MFPDLLRWMHVTRTGIYEPKKLEIGKHVPRTLPVLLDLMFYYFCLFLWRWVGSSWCVIIRHFLKIISVCQILSHFLAHCLNLLFNVFFFILIGLYGIPIQLTCNLLFFVKFHETCQFYTGTVMVDMYRRV